MYTICFVPLTTQVVECLTVDCSSVTTSYPQYIICTQNSGDPQDARITWGPVVPMYFPPTYSMFTTLSPFTRMYHTIHSWFLLSTTQLHLSYTHFRDPPKYMYDTFMISFMYLLTTCIHCMCISGGPWNVRTTYSQSLLSTNHLHALYVHFRDPPKCAYNTFTSFHLLTTWMYHMRILKIPQMCVQYIHNFFYPLSTHMHHMCILGTPRNARMVH